MNKVILGGVSEKIGSGATPRGGSDVYLPQGEIALIRSQNIYNDGFRKDGLAYITEKHAKELDNVAVEPNDILLNITGDSVARCCQVPDDILPARVNQHVAIIRPRKDKLDSRYLRYYLIDPATQDYMLMLASGGATRNALTKGMIESFEIPSPSIPEQRAIAGILGALDDKIEVNRRMNRTLESIARAVFRQWFVENEEVAGWKIGRLDDLLVLQRGFDLPTPQRIPGKYPVVAASGPSGTHNEYKIKGPGVTTGRSGVIGNVYFVHEDYWPLNTSLWIKEFKLAKPAFAYYFLKTLDLAIFNAGSAVPTLNRNHVHDLPVSIPPVELIEQFEGFAMPLLDKVYANEKESRTLGSLRDSLLPKLMRGEVRVKL